MPFWQGRDIWTTKLGTIDRMQGGEEKSRAGFDSIKKKRIFHHFQIDPGGFLLKFLISKSPGFQVGEPFFLQEVIHDLRSDLFHLRHETIFSFMM